MRSMEKWKAKNTSHFPTPPTAAASYLTHFPRYTNNLAGTNHRAVQPHAAVGKPPSSPGKNGRSFHFGNGPSKMRAIVFVPLIDRAANAFGALASSGRLCTENLVKAPFPSKQTMPAPPHWKGDLVQILTFVRTVESALGFSL